MWSIIGGLCYVATSLYKGQIKAMMSSELREGSENLIDTRVATFRPLHGYHSIHISAKGL